MSQSQCSHTPRSGFPHVSEPSIILRRYTTSLYEINQVLEEVRIADDPKNAQLLKEQLPARYEKYADVFSKREAESLPEHRLYNHKIVLKEPLPNLYSLLYKSNLEELEAIKKFI